MADQKTLCFYFQVHQPYRLRRYSVFENSQQYFDDRTNRHILDRVCRKCYIPATQLLIDLAQQHAGQFRIAMSFTGVVLEQLESQCPQAIEQIKTLLETGCCELLAETYHHSLAGLYSPNEFAEQVRMQQALLQRLFGVRSTTFRNTELIYCNQLASQCRDLGFNVTLAEGTQQLVAEESPAYVRSAALADDLTVLLRNYALSDDIAFRFSDRTWAGWPMTADLFADKVTRSPAAVNNVFMDFETIGEHQWAETGIFEFLKFLPQAALARGITFRTPAEVAAEHQPAPPIDVPKPISWADTERDISAWLGNGMQRDAAQQAYQLEHAIKAKGDPDLLRDWRRLTISDHFYYMSTKSFGDGAVHRYFNPYESPYDSYINYMNVLDSFLQRLQT